VSEVAFHFGAPDKLAYTCRLLRKAVGVGSRVLVVADTTFAARLDNELWALGPTDFVAHCLGSATPSLQRHSPVVITDSPDSGPLGEPKVLVNLTESIPALASGFGRVIEVVSLDEGDRTMARSRWKAYAARGDTIVRHDLSLKGQS